MSCSTRIKQLMSLALYRLTPKQLYRQKKQLEDCYLLRLPLAIILNIVDHLHAPELRVVRQLCRTGRGSADRATLSTRVTTTCF